MTKSAPLYRPTTINPYLHACQLGLSRLWWDLQPSAWTSRSALRKMRDAHSGKKAVIVCNGPSLLNSNLTSLSNVFTFGLNKVNLLFDKSSFRPSCIVAVNALVIDQNKDFYNATDLPLFINSPGRHVVHKRANVTYLHSVNVPEFARDCSLSIYEGATVTYVAMQLAFHMGFTQVALIGCDHNFATKGPAHATVVSSGADRDHFDPNYFGSGTAWQLPDLATSEMAYCLARKTYEAFGRRLVNSTVGGKLEILERMSLEDFFVA